MILRAEYDGASYLRYFQPDQELEVKTAFVRFFNPPGGEAEEAAWAGSSRFSEAQSFYDDLPGYTECHDDENLIRLPCIGFSRACRPDRLRAELLSNGFNGLRDPDAIRCDLLDRTTSYAMDNLAATVLHELH
jgi:hypothetical protein